ncbi:MAG: hypothetical protein ACOX2A_10855 [Tepidanaerobacteraceae bacterium]
MKLRQMISDSKLQTICGVQVTEIGDDYVKYMVDDKEEKIACDTVVLACGYSSNNEIIEQLELKGLEYRAIGDCVKPRKFYDAIHEGFHIARILFEE